MAVQNLEETKAAEPPGTLVLEIHQPQPFVDIQLELQTRITALYLRHLQNAWPTVSTPRTFRIPAFLPRHITKVSPAACATITCDHTTSSQRSWLGHYASNLLSPCPFGNGRHLHGRSHTSTAAISISGDASLTATHIRCTRQRQVWLIRGLLWLVRHGDKATGRCVKHLSQASADIDGQPQA